MVPMNARTSPIESLENRIAPAFAPVFSLAALDGTTGFTVPGSFPGDNLGFSVSGIGDVNNDRFHDFIVGAPEADVPGAINAGAAYVVFGDGGGFPANIDLTALDGEDGFRIDGAATGDDFGIIVSGGADVNGDSVNDIF